MTSEHRNVFDENHRLSNMRTIITISLIFFLVLSLTSAGCGTATKSPPAQTTATILPTSPREPPTSIPTPTPAPTPIPTVQKPTITDGFWCRETTMNIGKAPTAVTECYQFFPDMTYKWGYSPGRPMGKSLSCSGDPSAKCVYAFNAKGQYEVEGGYAYTLSGDTLIDPHAPPYFTRSSTGIP
jgi:hypothetical protein